MSEAQWTRNDVPQTLRLHIQGCGGDVKVNGHTETQLVMEGDEDLDQYVHQDGDSFTVSGYANDLEIRLPDQASLELNGIGGDVAVRQFMQLDATGIGGDLSIVDVPQLQLGTIGGDVKLQGAIGKVTIGRVGGDLRAGSIAQLRLKMVGGDVTIDQLDLLTTLGTIGGDLRAAINACDGEVRGTVGGDATLKLPNDIDVALRAFIGGDFKGSGEGWNLRRSSGPINLIFGDGENRLNLNVGGDLRVDGGTNAEQQSGDWRDILGSPESLDDLRGLGRELEEMGRNLAHELGNLGREIAREVRVAGRDARREMKEEYKSVFRRGPRVFMGLNDRKFHFDPEQIERLKREARAAAASGIARAQEAVEEALRQFQEGPESSSPPPRPPQPPRPPRGGYTGQTVRIDREPDDTADQQAAPESSTAPVNRDAERLAILRMVHEGRLAPDEAEILLRGLDDAA